MSHWSTNFSPSEVSSSVDLVATADTFEWGLNCAAGLMAFCLFCTAGKRMQENDLKGASYAFIGAVLSALAPSIAVSFLN